MVTHEGFCHGQTGMCRVYDVPGTDIQTYEFESR
jgi:hypothetical protein